MSSYEIVLVYYQAFSTMYPSKTLDSLYNGKDQVQLFHGMLFITSPNMHANWKLIYKV